MREGDILIIPGYTVEFVAGAMFAVLRYMHRCYPYNELVILVKNLLGEVGEDRMRRALRFLENSNYVYSKRVHYALLICPAF